MVMDKCTEFYPVEGGNLFGGEGGCAWSIGGGGSLLLWGGGGEGDGGANEEFSVGGGEGYFNNGKKAK